MRGEVKTKQNINNSKTGRSLSGDRGRRAIQRERAEGGIKNTKDY